MSEDGIYRNFKALCLASKKVHRDLAMVPNVTFIRTFSSLYLTNDAPLNQTFGKILECFLFVTLQEVEACCDQSKIYR